MALPPCRPVRWSALVALLALALVPAAAAAQGLPSKQVAAPPEEFLAGGLRLPDPLALVHRARHGELSLRWRSDGRGGGRWASPLPVGAAGPLTVVAIGAGVDDWTLALAEPGGAPRDAASLAAAGLATRRVDDVPGWRGGPRALALELAAERAGEWRLEAATPRAFPSGSAPDGVVLVADASPLVLATCLTTHALLSDETIGLRAWIERSGEPGVVLPGAFEHGVVELATPDGPRLLALHDDGRHDDGAAGDGLAGARLSPLPPGETVVAVRVAARGGDGRAVLRSSRRVLDVLPRAVMLTGAADARPDGDAVAIDLGALVLGAPRRVLVAAEVWGTDAQGAPVAVCWLARMVEVGALGGEERLSLRLDPRWLARAGAGAPLELRRVRVQDPDTQVPFDVRALIAVPGSAADAPPPPASTAVPGLAPAPVDPSMLTGAPPPAPAPGLGQVPRGPKPWDVGEGRALVLSHGYCSGGSIWPDADFTGPKIEFLDPDANRSHDQFAQLIAAAAAGRSSFGILAHSQGGNAALHLYTFYWSPLDLASGGRRIQAVASPWAGSPLAAELAGLGGIFGVGCGSNSDLSEGGAALWLASIPAWARDEVHFWTTANSGSACNFLTNLFLSSPNDGVVERVSGVLAGGQNMGHVTGWCHSTGMSNPANYLDHVRNAERDAAAAR